MRPMRLALIAILVASTSACASSRGFDRGALKAHGAEQREVTSEEIAKVLEKKAQLPSKYKLAVYFVPPSKLSTGSWRSPEWMWSGEDKDELLDVRAPLAEMGLVGDIFVIGSSIVEGTGRDAIRLAAARAGADAVLIVDGVADIDRYNNFLGVTYVLLVTSVFVPGTVADGLFMATATMWDVRNDFLYMMAEAEGFARQTAPQLFIEEEHVVRDAKTKAIAELRIELQESLARMAPRD